MKHKKYFENDDDFVEDDNEKKPHDADDDISQKEADNPNPIETRMDDSYRGMYYGC